MLVEFVRDVFIVVAALMGLIAFAIGPAQDPEPARVKPSLDTRVGIAPAVVATDGLAVPTSVSGVVPAH